MKKLLTILIFALGLTLIQQNKATAQATSFGIRGGINFATIHADGNSPDSRTGFTAGVYADFLPSAGSSILIQPEVLYSQKGYKGAATVGTSGNTVDVTFKLDYIEVPILAKYNIGTSGSILPYVEAGPFLAFIINKKAEAGGQSGKITQDINSFDLGGAIGAGINFNQFNLGARYTYGFTEITDNGGHNTVFQVVAGLSFD